MGKSNIATIDAEARDTVGTTAAKRLRAEGRVPAVLYGHGEETAHLSVDAHALWLALEHHAHLVELKTAAGPQQALIKEVQFDIYHTHVLHADFTRVALDETIEVEVPVVLRGEVKEALVELQHHTLSVLCRADSIPEEIRVDITGLVPGDVLHMESIKLPDGVTTELPGDTVVVSVHEQRDIEAEEAAAEEAAEGAEAEPELIGGKRDEEEEAEGESKE